MGERTVLIMKKKKFHYRLKSLKIHGVLRMCELVIKISE